MPNATPVCLPGQELSCGSNLSSQVSHLLCHWWNAMWYYNLKMYCLSLAHCKKKLLTYIYCLHRCILRDVNFWKPLWHQVKHRTRLLYQIWPLGLALDSAAAPMEPTNENVAAPQSIRGTVIHLVFWLQLFNLTFSVLKFIIKILNTSVESTRQDGSPFI